MEKTSLVFDSPKNQSEIIKVIGVGGGGSNAVNHMYSQGITGVDFIICNTDAQALDISPVPSKVQLGDKGLGAGSIPAVGKEAAMQHAEAIKEILDGNTKMVFITAGMGGGTGTGAAPVLAKVAKEMGILTVGIVTMPFSWEGRKRRQQADEGIKELKQYVDTLLIIANDKLRELHGNLKLSEAFCKADNILTTAAKGIAEIITVSGYINVDFEDVKTVMKDSGTAIMGNGIASGENRAIDAVEMALSSPLLNDNSIKGADNILLYITSGTEEISMDEVGEITEYIQDESGLSAEIIWGNGTDDTLEDNISITIIATGFNLTDEDNAKSGRRLVGSIIDNPKTPVQANPAPAKKITIIDKEPAAGQPAVSRPVSSTAHQTAPQPQYVTDEAQAHIFTPEDEPELNDIKMVQPKAPATPTYRNNEDNMERNSMHRIQKLRELSMKMNTPSGLQEMESTPAYIRRKIELKEPHLSSNSEVSRYTLNNEGDALEVKSDNSFLHDNVD